MISLILLRAFPGEDGRAPEIKMLAKRCTLFRRVMFFLVFRPFIQITASYEIIKFKLLRNIIHELKNKRLYKIITCYKNV